MKILSNSLYSGVGNFAHHSTSCCLPGISQEEEDFDNHDSSFWQLILLLLEKFFQDWLRREDIPTTMPAAFGSSSSSSRSSFRTGYDEANYSPEFYGNSRVGETASIMTYLGSIMPSPPGRLRLSQVGEPLV